MKKFRGWRWRRQFRPGCVVTRFVACDVRRDIEVVDVSSIESGVISARIHTWNVLYAANGVAPEPQFGDVLKIEIKHLWTWSGEPWGGPVPDSTDIVA
jgi:hypothetical protein